MFGSQKSAAQAYAKISVETGVAAASPHELIVMLFDGAIAALHKAQHAMEQGDIQSKGQLISKAITIINGGLYAALDRKAGGEIAENLGALYDYMANRLLVANLRNDVSILQEVNKLLGDLRSAWCEIKPAPRADAPADGRRTSSAYETYSSRPLNLATA
jgi:flagellar protein FliS